VFLYITAGQNLLVLSHVDYPEIGAQIPGGTIEEKESPEEAALREGFEETGIKGLRIASLLGTCSQDMTEYGKEEMLNCWYYHLIAESPQPSRWRHIEQDPSDGTDEPILFELYWQPIHGALELGGIDDRFIVELQRSQPSIA
jgi:8-oxo-dGTP pyrophosphatase MutT (NUDIX family)